MEDDVEALSWRKFSKTQKFLGALQKTLDLTLRLSADIQTLTLSPFFLNKIAV